MACYTPEPNEPFDKHLEALLCQACRFLTKEQISSINHGSCGYINLKEWYMSHLLHEATNENATEKEVERCFVEAKKMGWTINIEERSISGPQTMKISRL